MLGDNYLEIVPELDGALEGLLVGPLVDDEKTSSAEKKDFAKEDAG